MAKRGPRPKKPRKGRVGEPPKVYEHTPRTPAQPPKVHHVCAPSPERDHLEICFPRVEGYTHRVSADADDREVPRYEANREPGSTRHVDFWTSKPVRETQRSPLNFVVADTEKWEQTAAFYLETDPHVLAYAKNFNLGFAIPYTHGGETREYLPDFLVRVKQDGREVGTLILETKGYDPLKHIKVSAAQRWVEAVNAEGSWGRWTYRILADPTIAPAALESAAYELANPFRSDWHAALRDLAEAMRSLYGERLKDLVLYGSRARGDARWDSDIDVFVVLDRYDDFWAEFDRIGDVTGDLLLKHGVVVSATPTHVTEFEQSAKPVFVNARREGKHVA